MSEKEEAIVAELLEVQGKPVDLSGYRKPSDELADSVMCPSTNLNDVPPKLK